MSPANQTVIVKGHRRVLLDHPVEARALYDGLADMFRSAGLSTLQCDSREACDHLEGAEFLVGHSHGTRSILALYDPTRHRSVRGIILLDPSDADRAIWEALMVRRRAFIGKHLGRWWCREEWSHSIRLPDGHWFLESLPVIARELGDLREW